MPKKVYLSVEGEFESQEQMAEYLKTVVASIETAIHIKEPFHSCTAADGKGNYIKALSNKM